MEVKEHYGTVHPLLAIITVPTLRMLESFVVCEEDSNALLNSLFFFSIATTLQLENISQQVVRDKNIFKNIFKKFTFIIFV